MQSYSPGRVFEDLLLLGSATNEGYGSAPGVGVLLVGVATGSGILFGRRGIAGATIAVALLGLAMGMAARAGLEPVTPLALRDPAIASNWVRQGLIATAGAGVLGFIALFIMREVGLSTALVDDALRGHATARQQRWKVERQLEQSMRLQAMP